MNVVVKRAYGQLDDIGEDYPIAAQIPATQIASSGQAVGLVLAFFSTLMFFTSIMAQVER